MLAEIPTKTQLQLSTYLPPGGPESGLSHCWLSKYVCALQNRQRGGPFPNAEKMAGDIDKCKA